MKKPLVSRLLEIVLWFILVVGVVGIVSLPSMMDYYLWYFFGMVVIESWYRRFLLCFIRSSAILGLWITVEMIVMLSTMPDNPFSRRNVKALNRIGFVSCGLAVLFFTKLLLFITVLTLGGGILFTICALFAFTVANLINQAVTFKEENELTI
jgi:hypothetical protein